MYLSICKLENEAILRDLIEMWKLKAQKRTFSPGDLPNFTNKGFARN
jgi:hypothetical protein